MTVWDVTSLSYEPVEVIAIRLMELSGVVDRHVFVEAAETFTGRPRDIRWPEVRSHPLIAPHAQRVDHAVIGFRTRYPWDRDHEQRRAGVAVVDGLGCTSEDVILLADMDEVPHPDAVQVGVDRASEQVATRCMTTYREFAVDIMAVGSPSHAWEYHQPLVASRARIGDDAQAFRASQPMDRVKVPYGWHLTCQGSVEDIAVKMRSYAHTEHSEISPVDIAQRVWGMLDIVGRCEVTRVLDVPASARQFPTFMADHVVAAASAYLGEKVPW